MIWEFELVCMATKASLWPVFTLVLVMLFFILICADSDFGLAGIKNVHRVNAGGAE